MSDFRRVAAVLGMTAAVVFAVSMRATAVYSDARATVIVELFTSEGCSSCPPADDLLRRLIATQPVAGVEIIGLGQHVDYWDRLGWRDPFSSPLFSARQSAYESAVFRSDRIYTPQMVVDGTLEVLGSDAAAVRRTLLEAARQPKATVTVVAVEAEEHLARIDVRVEVPADVRSRRPADIMIAVIEDGLVSHVNHGENGGRTLSHGAVVRSLTAAARLNADAHSASASVAVPLASDWKPVNLRIVGFVQERAGRRIFGAGSSALRRDQ